MLHARARTSEHARARPVVLARCLRRAHARAAVVKNIIAPNLYAPRADVSRNERIYYGGILAIIADWFYGDGKVRRFSGAGN